MTTIQKRKPKKLTKSVWVPAGVLLQVTDKANKYGIRLIINDTDHEDDELLIDFELEDEDRDALKRIKNLIAEYREDLEDEDDDEEDD